MELFFYKLLPPRPTFPADITAAEAGAMQAHVAYWRGVLERDTAIVFGPVADPAGAYGVAIVRAGGEADARRLGEHDPAIVAGLGFRLEIHPMPRASARPATGDRPDRGEAASASPTA